jgi:hypothetical protein
MFAARKDGVDDRRHPMNSLVIGGPGAYIPYPSHSTLSDMGPDQWMLMLDCRCVLALYIIPTISHSLAQCREEEESSLQST